MRKSLIQKLALVTLIGGTMTFGSAAAIADGHEANNSKKKMDMMALDADKDGFLSMSEGDTDEYVRENFKKFDGNGDGKIDEAEFEAMAEENSRRKMDNVSISESFAELDTDGNGRLSREELAKNEMMADMFDDMDMNKDGEIDDKEAMDHDSRRKQEVSS